MDSTVWQYPFVDVFKLASLGTSWSKVTKSGKAEFELDRKIGKRVLKLTGSVSATNYVRFPKRKVGSSSASLGLTGRYVILQLCAMQGGLFVIHLEAMAKDQSQTRYSLSNMHKTPKRTGNVVQLPLALQPDCWTCVCLDMEALADRFKDPTHPSSFSILKSIQLCATVRVRGVFTTDIPYKFNPAGLAPPESTLAPKAIALPVAAAGGGEWTDHFKEYWIPKRPDMSSTVTRQSDDPINANSGKKVNVKAGKGIRASSSHISGVNPVKDTTVKTGKPTSRSPEQHSMESLDHEAPFGSESHVSMITSDSLANSAEESLLKQSDSSNHNTDGANLNKHHMSSISHRSNRKYASSRDQSNSNISKEQSRVSTLKTRTEDSTRINPDPFMKLSAIVGYSCIGKNSLAWTGDGKHIVFPSKSNIIVMRVADTPIDNQRQRILFGHTKDVNSLIFNKDYSILASAENGRAPLVRLWDFEKETTIAVIAGPANGVVTVCFSDDGTRLCVAGRDQHNRIQLVVWNIAQILHNKGKFNLVAKQTSEFDVESIRFAPYESSKLVSCGMENVRFWRIRNGTIAGCPVLLNDIARDTVFTDLCFEPGYGVAPQSLSEDEPISRSVFVSTDKGTVLQISLEDRQVAFVYKLHDESINSIRMNEGFCVTGSDDQYLRVWPLDFAEFFLEAKHEGPIRNVEVSMDGLKVAIGTLNGTVGVLDVTNHTHKTVLRSHTAPVLAVAFDSSREECVTCADDGTIRLWNVWTCAQLYEFSAPGELCKSLTFHPSERVFACGFDGGYTRVFGVANTVVLYEYEQHRSEVSDVRYTPEGEYLFSVGLDGNLCMYDVKQGYEPIRMISASWLRSGTNDVPVAGRKKYGKEQTKGQVNTSTSNQRRVGAKLAGVALGVGTLDDAVTRLTCSTRSNGEFVSKSGAATAAMVGIATAGISEGQPCTGLGNQPGAISVSPTGQFVAIVAPEGSFVLLLDIATFSPVCKIHPSHSNEKAVLTTKRGAESLRGSFGSTDSFALVEFSASGDALYTSSTHRRISMYRLRVESTSRDGGAVCCDLHLKKQVCSAHRSQITAMCPTSNGKHLITIGHDHIVKIWHSDLSGSPIAVSQSFVGHSGPVLGVAVSSSGSHIVTVGDDCAILTWSLSESSYAESHQVDHKPALQVHELFEEPSKVQFSDPSTNPQTSITREKEATGTDRAMKRLPQLMMQRDVATSTLVSRRKNAQDLFDEDVKVDMVLGASRETVGCVTWHISKGFLVYGHGNSVVVDALGNQTQQICVKGHSSPVSCVVVSLDGHTIFSGSGNVMGSHHIAAWQRVKYKDSSCWKLRQRWTVDSFHLPNGIRSMVLSPHGNRLASISMIQPHLCLWEVETGDIVHSIKLPGSAFVTVWPSCISPANSLIPLNRAQVAVASQIFDESGPVVCGSGYVMEFNNSGKLVGRLNLRSQANITACVVSPSWVCALHNCRATLAVGDDVGSVHIVTLGFEGQMQLVSSWSVPSSEDEVTTLCWSDVRLVAGTVQGNIVMWDVSSGYPVEASSTPHAVLMLSQGVLSACIDDTGSEGVITLRDGSLMYCNLEELSGRMDEDVSATLLPISFAPEVQNHDPTKAVIEHEQRDGMTRKVIALSTGEGSDGAVVYAVQGAFGESRINRKDFNTGEETVLLPGLGSKNCDRTDPNQRKCTAVYLFNVTFGVAGFSDGSLHCFGPHRFSGVQAVQVHQSGDSVEHCVILSLGSDTFMLVTASKSGSVLYTTVIVNAENEYVIQQPSNIVPVVGTVSAGSKIGTVSAGSNDGTVSTENNDGTLSAGSNDGTVSAGSNDGTVSTKNNDGTVSTENKDGTVSTENNGDMSIGLDTAGSKLLVTTNGVLHVFQVQTNHVVLKTLFRYSTDYTNAKCFMAKFVDPTGEYVAVCSDLIIEFFKVGSKKVIQTLTCNFVPTTLASNWVGQQQPSILLGNPSCELIQVWLHSENDDEVRAETLNGEPVQSVSDVVSIKTEDQHEARWDSIFASVLTDTPREILVSAGRCIAVTSQETIVCGL